MNLCPTINCLDHGFVKLIDCMPRVIPKEEESADHAIAEAARCSYQRGTKTVADDKTLIRYLMRHNHTSPLEMVEFKFHCKMPMFVARQWIRHRTANVNELSGRYSEMPEEYYIPETDNYRNQSVTNTQGSEGYIDESEAVLLMKQMEEICGGSFTQYHEFLKNGLVREQSRMILPLNTYTEWYWKIDLKNLLHFLNLRCDGHAQKEIQVYGNAILDLIKPIVPWTIDAWEDYSPYRGGMMLTKYEVDSFKKAFADDDVTRAIWHYLDNAENISGLEKKEWADKLKKLGFDD
jgi:thymidylate synthase (FAD)